jgi:sugar lactone lactonase YvrE
VADTGDNRVLIYDAPLSATSTATIAIGQTSMTQGAANQGASTPSATTLYSPTGLALDSAGNLWVADDHNCRVLKFKPPFTTGMSANLVIGQSDFQTTTAPYGPTCEASAPNFPINMYSIGSIAFDSKGDLWVAEGGAGRVLEYVPPFSNGMSPSLAIGQTNLTNVSPCNSGDIGPHGPILPPTAATLCGPVGIAFDQPGNLWVTDEANLRLLEFVPPFATGMAASVVLGQPNATVFTGGAECHASAMTFCGANALAFDANGNLWVSDGGFSRVMKFVPPFATGMAASLEIGEPNFTNPGADPNDPMFNPTGIAFDGNGSLIASDMASEILVYGPPFSTAMNPATIVSSGLGSCPPHGPTPNTLCEPVSVATF